MCPLMTGMCVKDSVFGFNLTDETSSFVMITDLALSLMFSYIATRVP
jgi:hypothetical protein